MLVLTRPAQYLKKDKINFFIFFYYKLIFFLVFSNYFDMLMSKIIFKK
jgi:hypothetical protein